MLDDTGQTRGSEGLMVVVVVVEVVEVITETTSCQRGYWREGPEEARGRSNRVRRVVRRSGKAHR